MNIEKTHRALLMYVGIAKTLNDETCRFLNEFKHDNKRRFNNYVGDLTSFQNTVRKNMNMEGVDAAEQLQDYQHRIIQELIEKEKYKDIETFLAFSKMLSLVYNSYLKMYRHTAKDNFTALNNSANIFRNTLAFNNAEQKKVDDYIYGFVVSLIENNEWSRETNNA